MRLLHKISENRKLIIVSSLCASLSSEHLFYILFLEDTATDLNSCAKQIAKKVIRLGSVCMREGVKL